MAALNLILLQMNGPQHMMDGWGGGTGMIFMVIFWLVVLGLLVTLIWFLIRKGSSTMRNSAGETPLEILQKRYARGDIDEEEYRRMKEEIKD